MGFAENGLESSLTDFEDTLVLGDSIVGWVLWKDDFTEMIALGGDDGQPRLFTSYSAAKWEKGLLDVIEPVTQQRYDELCGKKVVTIEWDTVPAGRPLAVSKPRKRKAEKAKRFAEPLERIPKAGFVYLVKAVGLDEVYKIGQSTEPAKRISQMQTHSPVKLVLECLISSNDMSALEARVHKRFAKQRLHCEWFGLSEEDVFWIKELKKMPQF